MLAQAAVLLPTVRFALKFVTVARLQLCGVRTLSDSRRNSPALMPSGPSNGETKAPSIDLSQTTGLAPETIARLVRVAAERGPYRAKCLEQSLLLRWLLLRQGIEAQIMFGARKEDEQMQAHAWVEVKGVALSEDNGVHRDFSPLYELVTGN